MLNINHAREYLLSHELLSQQKERGKTYKANLPCVVLDFQEGIMHPYRGTFVAYQKGILCGQSEFEDRLYEQATNYYEESSLAVFPVPIEDITAATLTSIMKNEGKGRF